MKIFSFLILATFLLGTIQTTHGQLTHQVDNRRFSTNGFFTLQNSQQRAAYNFNNGWRYFKGDCQNAQKPNFQDNNWQQVQLPHGVDILTEEASGGVNYQGVVWYRKHFKLPDNVRGKLLTLTFEAIMGKCSIYLNGQLIRSHKGGYLPIVINLSSNGIHTDGTENIIAVKADNSDDPSYPPGKPEYGLDFCYFGGIYRNAWLVVTNKVHITDANIEQKAANNGVKISYDKVSEKSADIHVTFNVINESINNQKLTLEYWLTDNKGHEVVRKHKKLTLNKKQNSSFTSAFTLDDPLLWQPDHPYLYRLYTVVKDQAGNILDGYYQRVGIKSVQLMGKNGILINGQPFKEKLIGANHHQDYAYIGNAVPDNLFWNDAIKIKDAGIRILRLSHYPQANAFMEACDELGIFTIVPTPGWQFWNKDSGFAKFMYRDIRQMIRRDRNHASIFAWEPIPNETHYPAYFAKEAYSITHQEDPNPHAIAACDIGSADWEEFDLIYGHPFSGDEQKTDKCLFTREWGDNVDNWSAHNSPSRASLEWGEIPQLVQAEHYSKPPYNYTSMETFYKTSKQFIGGCLWHFFDTQRGYHPDPFYGGIVDAFRQPKYAYEMFKSQENPRSAFNQNNKQSPYTLFIANILSPFSPADVTIYTNCDSVKLIAFGADTITVKPDSSIHLPHPAIIVKNLFSFMKVKDLYKPKSITSKPGWDAIIAIGYADGKEVVRAERHPSKRASKIKLKADLEGVFPVANGSFIIPVFAEMQDENGVIKRLTNAIIHFKVIGEGILIGQNTVGINPRRNIWGIAPALVRTTLKPGTISIIAEMAYPGHQTPVSDTLIIHTTPPYQQAVYRLKDVDELKMRESQPSQSSIENKISDKQKKEILKKVESDQTFFMGEKK